MNSNAPIHETTSALHESIKKAYYDLLKSTSFSLQELLNSPDLNLTDYCKSYQYHPGNDDLVNIVQEFGEKYGIWLPNAKYYVTSATFLFPSAGFKRAITLIKNLAVDYYLNETCGRDVFWYLPAEEQSKKRAIIQRIIMLDEHLKIDINATEIEYANIEMLSELKELSPISWFRGFLKHYLHHIDITHRDCSVKGLGYIPSVARYIAMRNYTGGMPHMIYCVEFSTDNFLNQSWLAEMKLTSRIKALHRSVSLFGSLSNDLFSFENEVIDKNSDPNLVMVLVFNHPDLSLVDVLKMAIDIVKKVFKEFRSNLSEIKRIINSGNEDTKNKIILEIHLSALEEMMQACWVWQVHTKQYKRKESIWQETQLKEKV